MDLKAAVMSSSLFPPRGECAYAASYCEENVWQLCAHVRRKNPALLQHCFAVFVSNAQRLVRDSWHLLMVGKVIDW